MTLYGYRASLVHFGIVRFFMAIPTEYEGTQRRGERSRRRGLCAFLRNHIGFEMLSAGRTLGLRAPDCAKESSTLWTLFTLRRGCVGACSRRLCVFAQPYWPCHAFRGESVGGCAPPNLRQRVFDSLDSLHAAAGLCWCVFAAPSPGYTERPARVQFMLGRVGLYIDVTYTRQRPDSSRPQAARSRVACAKRSGVQGIIPCLRTRCGRWRIRCSTGRWVPTCRGFSG